MVYHTAEKQCLLKLHGHYGLAQSLASPPLSGTQGSLFWNIACVWHVEERAQHELGDMCHLCVLFVGQHKSYRHSWVQQCKGGKSSCKGGTEGENSVIVCHILTQLTSWSSRGPALRRVPARSKRSWIRILSQLSQVYLGLPFPLVWPKVVSDPKKNPSSCALFSSTSGETQLHHIFVPKSLNCSLNWLPSHLFQTEEEKFTCKEKEKAPPGQAEASFGDQPL